VGDSGGGIITIGTNPVEKILAEITKFAFMCKGLSKGIETSPNVLAVERVSANGSDAGLVLVEMGHAEGYAKLPRQMRNVITNEIVSGQIALAPYTVLFYE
jgi:hypothetical protein